MGSIKTISIIVAANIKGLEAGMSKANKSLANFASNATRIGSMLSFGVTAPLTALGKSAFDAFSQFENGMMKVKAVTQSSASEMEILTSEAKRLGETTQFTALQVANLQLVLGRKGFDPTAIKNMEQSILDLALATGEDLNLAAQVVGSSLNAFSRDASDAKDVANTLAMATTRADLTLAKFSTSFATAGAGASAVGVDLEELAAMMGVLMDSGIKASKAGTGLNGLFVALKENGISFSDTLDMVSEGQMGLDRATKLVGKNFNKQLLILSKNREKTKALAEEYRNNTTALDDMAALMSGTAYDKVLKMESAIFAMKIEMGALLADSILPIIKYITELTKSFSSLEESTQKLILKIGAIAAIVGPLLIIIGLLTSLAAIISGPVVLGISLISAGIYLAINVINQFARLFSSIVQAISDNINAIADRFSNFASRVKNFFIKAFTEAVAFIDKYAQKVGIDWFKTDGEPVFDELIPDDELAKFVSWSDSVETANKNVDDLTASMKKWIKTKLGMNAVSNSGSDAPPEKIEFVKSELDFSSEYEKSLEIVITPKIKFDLAVKEIAKGMEDIANKVLKFTDTWGAGIEQVGAIFSQVYKNKGIAIDNDHKKQLDSIEGSSMSEKNKEKAIQTLNEETAKKQLVLKRKQAKVDKAMAMFNIIQATALAIMKAAPNPYAMIAMGALGAIQLGVVASQPVPAFAQGGLVTGATMGLVGEGRGTTMSNPEVIAPLDKLKSMLGDVGGGGTIIPDVRISGDDLLIVFDRASRRKSYR